MENKILDTWYQGRCHAPGLITEEESEIFEASQGTTATIIAEEEPDLDAAYDELEVIKRHLMQLRSKLILTPDSCEEKIATSLQDASFQTDNQQQLFQLQSSNSLLKCQLQKLMQHLNATRNQIKILESMRCQLSERLSKISKELTKFDEFKQQALDYFAICIERNEQIKTCKVDNEHFAAKIKALIYHTESRMSYLVPIRCHHQLHYDLSVELVLMRIFLHSLFGTIMHDWNQCKRHLMQSNWRCSAILPNPSK